MLLVKWISSGKRVRVQLSRYLEARESQRDGDHGRRAAGSAGESGASHETASRAGGAGCHSRSARSKALASVISLRMTATMATLCCLPLARRRSKKACISGLKRIAVVAAM